MAKQKGHSSGCHFQHWTSPPGCRTIKQEPDCTFHKDHIGHKVPRDTKPLDLDLRLVAPHPKGKAFGVIPMSLYPHKANQVKQSPSRLYKEKTKQTLKERKSRDEKGQFHSYRPRRGSDPKLGCQSRPRKDRGTGNLCIGSTLLSGIYTDQARTEYRACYSEASVTLLG